MEERLRKAYVMVKEKNNNCKWIFSIKHKANRFIARLIANSYTQIIQLRLLRNIFTSLSGVLNLRFWLIQWMDQLLIYYHDVEHKFSF